MEIAAGYFADVGASLRRETSYTTADHELSAAKCREASYNTFFNFLDVIFQAVIAATKQIIFEV